MTVKQILFVTGGLKGGGQERSLVNFANEFSLNGYSVTIVCLFKTEVFFDLDPKIEIIWPKLQRNKYYKFVYAFKLIQYLRKNIKLNNSKIVISFGDWYNSYVIFSTLFLNKKIFITNRMGPDRGYGFLVNFFNKILYPLATGLIVQTERSSEIFRKKYKLKNIEIVENILNPINIQNIRKENLIVSVGRTSREKGHSILIKAFANTNKLENWELFIIGDGPELPKLKKLVSELNLDSKVLFLGHLKNFNNEFSKASIFVLPSYFEGFPNSLLEAMSVPIASIASDCIAGPKEIIEPFKNGLLFDPGNVNQLTDCLNLLMEDESLRNNIAKEGYKVRDKYTLANSFCKFESFILRM